MPASLRGWSPFVALQAPYSLADRDVERELLPMARALGLTFTRWGMLERIEAGGAHRARGTGLRHRHRRRGQMIEARPEWLEWAAQEVSASG